METTRILLALMVIADLAALAFVAIGIPFMMTKAKETQSIYDLRCSKIPGTVPHRVGAYVLCKDEHGVLYAMPED